MGEAYRTLRSTTGVRFGEAGGAAKGSLRRTARRVEEAISATTASSTNLASLPSASYPSRTARDGTRAKVVARYRGAEQRGFDFPPRTRLSVRRREHVASADSKGRSSSSFPTKSSETREAQASIPSRSEMAL